jgi:16S rRNA (guanine(966)-N(2))-methyltransferase RsmD
MGLRIHGNRLLKTLPGPATRPTLAKVREAVFNIWQGTIAGCRWLDICTGSGAMGAEALCRGATVVVGIEQSLQACAVIQHNWRQVAQPDQSWRVLRGNAVSKLASLAGQQFDHIYFDPPYDSDIYQPVLAAIAQHHLLASTAELAVEHRLGPLAVNLDKLEICREKTYGHTGLTFYRLRSQD